MIPYELRLSTRAKRMRLEVHLGGTVMVTVPKRAKHLHVEAFVRENSRWIIRQLQRRKEISNKDFLNQTQEHFLLYKDAALALAKQKVFEWNAYYNFVYEHVQVKKMRTRWGSCSIQRQLNFNYKMVFLNEAAQNYLVVHELCHLGEMNHSKRFWALVEQSIPDYQAIRKQFFSLY